MLIFNKFFTTKTEINNNLVKIKFSENILNELLLNRIGKATSKDEIKYYKYTNQLNKLSPLIFNKLKPKVKLIATSVNSNQLPDSNLPEMCVYGSYNVGKSSLINSILNKSNFCKTRTKTNKLHFYRVGSPGIVLLVDMPGYSNSNLSGSDSTVDKTSDINEARMIEFCLSYLKYRNNLVLTIILIDPNRGLTKEDLELINYCNYNKLKFLVILNKCDLIKPIELTKKIQIIRNQLNIFKHQLFPIIPVSSTKLQNLNQLRQLLTDYISEMKPFYSENNNSKQVTGGPIKVKVNNSTGTIGTSSASIIDRTTNRVISIDGNGFIGNMTNKTSVDNGDTPDKRVDGKELIESTYIYKQIGLTPTRVSTKDNCPINLNLNGKNEVKVNIEGDNLIKLNLDNSSIINSNKSEGECVHNSISCDNNLIEEKRQLFKRKLSNYLFTRYRISKLKLNTSYKRVFSLYKCRLINQTNPISNNKK